MGCGGGVANEADDGESDGGGASSGGTKNTPFDGSVDGSVDGDGDVCVDAGASDEFVIFTAVIENEIGGLELELGLVFECAASASR